MKIRLGEFRAPEKKKVNLDKYPTRVDPFYASPEEYETLLEAQKEKMRKLQELHFVNDSEAILIIFQAMDAAGKDGAIKHVMSGMNPVSCEVSSFRAPSAIELDHDFLWRAELRLPERGQIGIFNRSYYEEVLVVRVHPEFLKPQKLPPNLAHDKSIWKSRYQSIRDFEKHLLRNGTRVIKFFLHVSKDEQKERLMARIDDPEKHWKVNAGDTRERKFWDDYMHAYEQCIENTSTSEAPWFIVPADDKMNARLIVAHAVTKALESLHLDMPKLTPARKKELAEIRTLLSGEG